MASNFLRFKLLMLSRASYEVIYTEAKRIFSTFTSTSAVKFSVGNDSEARMDNEVIAQISADIAALLDAEARITGVLDGKGELGVALSQQVVSDILANLDNKAGFTTYKGVDTEPKITLDLAVDCLPKLLLHEHKIVVNNNERLNFDVGANIAALIKTAVSEIKTSLHTVSSAKIVSILAKEARITGVLDGKGELGVASPLHCEVRSRDTGETLISLRVSPSVYAPVTIEGKSEVSYTPSIYKRTRISDFGSQRISDFTERRLSELKYNEINL